MTQRDQMKLLEAGYTLIRRNYSKMEIIQKHWRNKRLGTLLKRMDRERFDVIQL